MKAFIGKVSKTEKSTKVSLWSSKLMSVETEVGSFRSFNSKCIGMAFAENLKVALNPGQEVEVKELGIIEFEKDSKTVKIQVYSIERLL